MSIYRWVWHLIPSQPQLPIPNYGLADDVAIIQHQTGVLRSSNMTSSHDKLFCCRIVWGSNRSLPQIFTPANIQQAHFHVFFQVEPIEGTNVVMDVLDGRSQTSQIRDIQLTIVLISFALA